MAELIDRNAFRDFWNKNYRHQYANDTFLFAIANFPTIDAVPVVRCKDCKHMNVVGVGYRWCKAWERIQTMGDDGFCCFGERKDNDL